MLKKIGVLFGGCSPEYEISLQSAYAVASHLEERCYEVILIGITKDGRWFRFAGDKEQLLDDTWSEDGSCVPAMIVPDRGVHGLLEFHTKAVKRVKLAAVFPVLHGRNGEDGTVQGLLELAGIPIVGCKTLSSALCMDKAIAHSLAKEAGIAVPHSITVKKMGEWSMPLPKQIQKIMQQARRLHYPLFVKPARGGSSIGITRVREESELAEALLVAWEEDDKLVIEEEVQGFEVGCAVVGSGGLKVSAVDEVQMKNGFLDFGEKYAKRTALIRIPARISQETALHIQSLAQKIYELLECTGFARIDFFLTKHGDILFNEVNTIPGMTEHSRFPSMLNATGWEFSKIVNQWVQQACCLEEEESNAIYQGIK